jgi:Fe-S cluster biogenesis protein NfuA
MHGNETTTPPEEHAARARDLADVIAVISVAVEADGGHLTLQDADFDTGRVIVQLSGACGSCTLAGATIEDGITRILQQRLPWFTELVSSVEASTTPGYGSWRG